MRIIGFVADKLLGAVLPQLKAAACCGASGSHFTESCGCLRNGVGLQKSCVINCACITSCGACTAVPNAACR